MGDYLSPRKQQVVVRLRERLERVRRESGLSYQKFEIADPHRRDQEKQETEEYYRRFIDNRNKRVPRNVKQENSQSKVKSESNGNCSTSEMGRNQVVKKAVERKRPNPDSPNLAGPAEGLKNNTLSYEAAGSSGALRGDASPAKKPCLDTKPLPPGQAPPNQYLQQPPNNQGHAGDSNLGQMQHGAAASDALVDPAQAASMLGVIDDNADVMKLLDDPSGSSLDDLMKSGNFNADMLVQELMKLEENLNKQLGEIPEASSNSPSSQDANRQSEMKPDTPSNNQDTPATLKTEITDSHDPMMMKGPPNTVATEAVQKSGPLPGIQEFKSAAAPGVMIKQETPQVNASQATGAMFNESSVKTVASNGAHGMRHQLAQQSQLQTSFSSTPTMNSSMRVPLVSQQSSVPAQQQNYLTAQQQQQQQMNRGQFMQNPRMTNQQNLTSHQRVSSTMHNTMNNPMSSADQLTQFANNQRGQSNQSSRLPGIGTFGASRQANFASSNQGMSLPGQSGTMMPTQTAQFAQNQTQQRVGNPELLQRLQRPPNYSSEQQRSKIMANLTQGQQSLSMQPGSSQMVITTPRRPPPRYDEARMSFQGPVNPAMQQQTQQQMGQPQGMMSHMNSSMATQRLQPIAAGQNLQGQASGMLANHMNGIGGSGNSAMTQERLQMQRLRQQQLRNQLMMQQNGNMPMNSGNAQQHPAAMGNQISMGQVSGANMSMNQQGMGQYSRHPQLAGQWTNQMVQQRVQQGGNFAGNNMMSQSYGQQSRFPQRNIMDSSSNMRTFQNMTAQGGLSSNVTNANASMIKQQQQQQQQQQQRFMVQSQQAQHQQPQQQAQQTVQANQMASLPNGPAVAATNQSFNANPQQQMQMGMMPNSTSQQQSGSTDMLDLLDNIIKNDGSSRPNSQT